MPDFISFIEYDGQARKTALPELDIMPNHVFWMLGLQGEVGELFEKVKKIYRDSDGVIDKEAISKELGDILWYWNQVVHSFGLFPEQVARENLVKLAERQTNGTLQGNGDNR